MDLRRRFLIGWGFIATAVGLTSCTQDVSQNADRPANLEIAPAPTIDADAAESTPQQFQFVIDQARFDDLDATANYAGKMVLWRCALTSDTAVARPPSLDEMLADGQNSRRYGPVDLAVAEKFGMHSPRAAGIAEEIATFYRDIPEECRVVSAKVMAGYVSPESDVDRLSNQEILELANAQPLSEYRQILFEAADVAAASAQVADSTEQYGRCMSEQGYENAGTPVAPTTPLSIDVDADTVTEEERTWAQAIVRCNNRARWSENFNRVEQQNVAKWAEEHPDAMAEMVDDLEQLEERLDDLIAQLESDEFDLGPHV